MPNFIPLLVQQVSFFAIRTNLFQDVEKDTLLDDLLFSLRVAMDAIPFNTTLKHMP